MSLARYLDVTSKVNATGGAILDIGGWDFADLQLDTPTGQINFETSNDSGAITGVSDGSEASADNFLSVQGTNLGTGSSVSSLSTSGIVKFNGIGRYLKVYGAGQTVAKALLRLYKIN